MAYEYHSADISIKANVETVLATVRPQVIIHTASPVALSTNAALYYRVNVDGTRNLLECARSIKTVKAFIYTASASVVHDSISDLIDADESFPVLYVPDQKEIYSHTKALADDLVRAANGSGDGMLTVCLRPAGIFGEGDQNTLRKMIENAEAGENRFQIGSGKNLFDWTYVGNVAGAHILAAEALLLRSSSASGTNLPRVDGEAFFITNGDPMPFWDFVRAIGDAAGFPVDGKDVWVIPKHLGLTLATIVEWIVWTMSFGMETSTMTRGGIRYSCLTRTYRIDKARARLGYKPTVDMNEGIRRGVDWWVAEKMKKSQ
jgi:sterol-4alpha-carboxylate 3-dehydrogenase (decarboxylating)